MPIYNVLMDHTCNRDGPEYIGSVEGKTPKAAAKHLKKWLITEGSKLVDTGEVDPEMAEMFSEAYFEKDKKETWLEVNEDERYILQKVKLLK